MIRYLAVAAVVSLVFGVPIGFLITCGLIGWGVQAFRPTNRR